MGFGCVGEILSELSKRLSAKARMANDKLEGHMLFPVGVCAFSCVWLCEVVSVCAQMEMEKKGAISLSSAEQQCS